MKTTFGKSGCGWAAKSAAGQRWLSTRVGRMVAALGVSTVFFAATPAQAGWVQVWNDEFDNLNYSKWSVEDWASTRNNELQYYAPSDVWTQWDGSIGSNVLVLRSQKRNYGGRSYTSGAVNSKSKYSFVYGRVVVRAKLPKGKGIWPAHWMLPQDGSWPPEIDIMEMLGNNPWTVYMTYHRGTWNTSSYKQIQNSYTGPDFSSGYHNFEVMWEPGHIRWFIDGVLRHETWDTVTNKSMYLLLNTAVGGNWPGNPDASTYFPVYHYIDYVRVYQWR